MTPVVPVPTAADDDDDTVGRILSRREVLAVLGSGAGAALLAACLPQTLSKGSAVASGAPAETATPSGSSGVSSSGAAEVPSCVVVPELTEGPYYVDGVMERSDIRGDPAGGDTRDGVPLALSFAVSRVDGSSCAPFEGAVLDLWHCDALGEYSGISNGAGQSDTSGSAWLRGYQVTDANGLATFTTIYPGWYSGRAVHIHFKIRTNPASNSGREFTSQLFFDDDLSAGIFTSTQPYAKKGAQDVTNDRDNIFAESNGQLTLAVTPEGDGYAATMAIGVQLS